MSRPPSCSPSLLRSLERCLADFSVYANVLYDHLASKHVSMCCTSCKLAVPPPHSSSSRQATVVHRCTAVQLSSRYCIKWHHLYGELTGCKSLLVSLRCRFLGLEEYTPWCRNAVLCEMVCFSYKDIFSLGARIMHSTSHRQPTFEHAVAVHCSKTSSVPERPYKTEHAVTCRFRARGGPVGVLVATQGEARGGEGR